MGRIFEAVSVALAILEDISVNSQQVTTFNHQPLRSYNHTEKREFISPSKTFAGVANFERVRSHRVPAYSWIKNVSSIFFVPMSWKCT